MKEFDVRCYAYKDIDAQLRINLIGAWIALAPNLDEYRHEKPYKQLRKLMMKTIEGAFKPEIIDAHEEPTKIFYSSRTIPRNARQAIAEAWTWLSHRLDAVSGASEQVITFDKCISALRISPDDFIKTEG